MANNKPATHAELLQAIHDTITVLRLNNTLTSSTNYSPDQYSVKPGFQAGMSKRFL
jgi:hypothetical protein